MMRFVIRVMGLNVCTAAFFLAGVAGAQTASVKDIPLDQEGSTTITIEKGTAAGKSSMKEARPVGRPVENEVLDGTAEIEGDPAPLVKQAKENWKKACADWKAEVKDLNRENQVVMMNCSTPRCEPDAHASTVCRSNATYKIRLKVQ